MTEAELGTLEDRILNVMLQQPKPWFFHVLQFFTAIDRQVVNVTSRWWQ